ncbi:thiolase family protein [Microbacterium thalassium]|uniref:Acetyl-CoA acyltransferase n=1 Tax=Microbacterium thalassium TaxID=362649 RepID=A0A7X0KTV1_9MICO|nr:thiolase family protein [Microbacterium thalassium]MBB6390510.1 acetyl-CoA acyltransferase [Microbacterium thalassium]GLK25621.1 acetyl-CoA acyltransferase [Microbacterium thalassium]
MTSAVIVDAVRTASGKGKPGGALSGVHPSEMLATVIRALVDRAGIDPALIDDVIAGCVSQVGDQSNNIARTAALLAGLPVTVPGTTVDRQCGSSQQAAHFAAQGVIAGAYDIAIAAGVESMSRVPMFSNGQGGHPHAGLDARFPSLPPQGIGAELICSRWGFDRDAVDAFAAASHSRAAAAQAGGVWDREIIPVTLPDGSPHTGDETVRPTTSVEGLAGLAPAFRSSGYGERYPEIDWKITAGNSSPLTDGASGMLIMSEDLAQRLDLTPRARFHSFAVIGSDPEIMLTGPIDAARKIMAKAGMTISDFDAYEVNEAFAPVPMAWAEDLGADPALLNPRGGAIALGHPLGASGTRLMTTMLHYLEDTGGRFGLQAICEAGGMANATIIERL